MFRLITKSWNMYFLGFLLGLDFDIATEVGLLGISAASAHKAGQSGRFSYSLCYSRHA
jgi:high-affinity nickel permease